MFAAFALALPIRFERTTLALGKVEPTARASSYSRPIDNVNACIAFGPAREVAGGEAHHGRAERTMTEFGVLVGASRSLAAIRCGIGQQSAYATRRRISDARARRDEAHQRGALT
jgi:hypothetical protein